MTFFLQLIERETRRERMLEARHREQRLRARVRHVAPVDYMALPPGARNPIEVAEEKYLHIVDQVRTTK